MKARLLIILILLSYFSICCSQSEGDYVDIVIPEDIATMYDGDYKISSGDALTSIINNWAHQGGYKPYMKFGEYKGIGDLNVPIDVVFFDNIVDSLDSFIDKINSLETLQSENIFIHACLYKNVNNPTLLIQVNSNDCP
ncbi:MAG: hypothetical protein QM504_03275 [Pseudomonadota bacterium]